MSVQVTLKLTSKEFDNLRKAVKYAQEKSHEAWAKLKSEKADREISGPWYDFSVTCERLLEHALS